MAPPERPARPQPPSATKLSRQQRRDRLLPVGMACEVHDGTRATVPGTVVDNTGVLVKVRLGDDRVVFRYDHEVFAPAAD